MAAGSSVAIVYAAAAKDAVAVEIGASATLVVAHTHFVIDRSQLDTLFPVLLRARDSYVVDKRLRRTIALHVGKTDTVEVVHCTTRHYAAVILIQLMIALFVAGH